MGRKWELRLDLKPPSLFRCPISLEVMRSPVSLCTGVTYDRSSIQRWLDSGHTTCPATMLPLPSTDLVPNLTLRRLISLWSSQDHNLLSHLRSSPPADSLHHLLSFLSDPDVDDFLKNTLLHSPDFLPSLLSILNHDAAAAEAVVAIVSLILASHFVEQVNREAAISALMSDVDQTMASLVSVLKNGSTLDARIGAATIVQPILSASCLESRILMAERVGLVPELIRLIGNSAASDAGLGCLIELSPSSSKRVRKAMARAGAVPALSQIISLQDVASKVAERAMKLLEAVGNCVEGRAAMCEIAEECVRAVVGRMMKVGKEGREAAVGVLWSVCYNAVGGDQRGREAVAVARGGLAKVLVVMQGDCSPEVRRMAGDLLRVFRIDSESRELAGYDTKTTHIMPF